MCRPLLLGGDAALLNIGPSRGELEIIQLRRLDRRSDVTAALNWRSANRFGFTQRTASIQ
jgi:hypothetical protein